MVKNISVANTYTPPKLDGLIQPRGMMGVVGGGGGGGGGGGQLSGTQMSEAGPIRNHSGGGGGGGGRQATCDRPSPISVDGEHIISRNLMYTCTHCVLVAVVDSC